MAVSLKTAESLFRSTDNGGTNKGEFPGGCRQVIFKDRIHFNSHYPGSAVLPNTCNVSVLGPTLPGWRVLSQCRRLLASVGAACHSDSGNRPSPILLNCGVPKEVAANALRLSVGRGTTRKDVDDVLEDLKETVLLLEKNQLKDLK